MSPPFPESDLSLPFLRAWDGMRLALVSLKFRNRACAGPLEVNTMNARSLRLMLGCVALSAFALVAVSCGSSSSPTTPSPTPGGGGGGGTADLTITIVGMNGSQSFSPNPGTVNVGQTVSWRNADSITHSLAADNGSFSTGDIAPGATSGPIAMGTAGSLAYHCQIHPTMVGSLTVNGTQSYATR
jgi:plastocyanin